MKFSGAMIGSENPGRLGAFYSKVLGDPTWHDGTWYGWEGDANLMIGAHSDVHGTNPTPQRIILTLVVDDVDTAFKELTALGAEVVAEPYQTDGGPRLATVTDPDGNYVQMSPVWED